MSHDPSPPEHLQAPNRNDTWWLLRRIWDRLNTRNEHFMATIVGQEGSGKSYTAMRIADEIDPTFNADRVIFDVTELLRTLRDRQHQPGQFFVLDEAGVQLGNRTWHDRGQILVNQALQLIRNHNLGLLFTLPRLGELDSQAQGRLQAFYEIIEKEPDQYVRGKWKFLNPDRTDSTGTIYKKFPRRRENGAVKRITSIALRPPRSDLVEPYEERKATFQEGFYDDVIKELEAEEEEEQKERQDPAAVAEEIINDPDPFISHHNINKQPYLDTDLIRSEFSLSIRDAKTAKSQAEREIDLDAAGSA